MKTTPALVLAIALVLAAGSATAQDSMSLARADTNSDGAVSRVEAQAARVALFDRLDANRDDALTEAERGGRGARRFARADSDGDGRVSRTELTSQPIRAFDRFDANSDERLDASELERLHTALQSSRR